MRCFEDHKSEEILTFDTAVSKMGSKLKDLTGTLQEKIESKEKQKVRNEAAIAVIQEGRAEFVEK